MRKVNHVLPGCASESCRDESIDVTNTCAKCSSFLPFQMLHPSILSKELVEYATIHYAFEDSGQPVRVSNHNKLVDPHSFPNSQLHPYVHLLSNPFLSKRQMYFQLALLAATKKHFREPAYASLGPNLLPRLVKPSPPFPPPDTTFSYYNLMCILEHSWDINI